MFDVIIFVNGLNIGVHWSQVFEIWFCVFPLARGSFRGDANFYGKGAIQFYTQVKTVTSQWKAEDATVTAGSATVMPVMQ